MKPHAIVLLLAVVALVATAPAARAAEMPEAIGGICPAVDSPAVNADGVAVAPVAPVDNAVLPGKVICEYPNPNPAVYCSHWNSSYCTYAWNCQFGCCEPTWVASGAYCPSICI